MGQAVYAKVVERNTKPQRFMLSLTGGRSPSGLHMLHIYRWISPVDGCRSFCVAGVTELEEGAVTLGMVANVDPQRGLLVQLPFGGMGAVAVTDLADAYRPNPLDGYRRNQIVRSVSWRSVLTCLHNLNLAVFDVHFKNLFSATGASFFGTTIASGSCPCVHQGLRCSFLCHKFKHSADTYVWF